MDRGDCPQWNARNPAKKYDVKPNAGTISIPWCAEGNHVAGADGLGYFCASVRSKFSLWNKMTLTGQNGQLTRSDTSIAGNSDDAGHKEAAILDILIPPSIVVIMILATLLIDLFPQAARWMPARIAAQG